MVDVESQPPTLHADNKRAWIRVGWYQDGGQRLVFGSGVPEHDPKRKINGSTAGTVSIRDGCRYETIQAQITGVRREGLYGKRLVVILAVLELGAFSLTIDRDDREVIKSVVMYLFDIDESFRHGPQDEVD
ncbi:hypothetical protein Val02_63120 [Virgisporangium aliadipatigenens]|uniref:Uncharacterized protein n=1 Tax=Virgisporangium aliadipatigenens TaxID=741659 RepID=A0A8J3YQ83_9ACTN|nr:hypothetical protein [Virgisporangium aliadipatigenens]GIJ49426.1 hypothetical protein Val02_63120 [Virgisporangium aliadipatigenens]